MIPKRSKKSCKLNDRTEFTKGVIHLLVTSLCNRNCRYCCNKFYSLDDIPQVTDEELQDAHTICITGGEPFAYSNPVAISSFLKTHYPNIKRVIVYSNALELFEYLENGGNVFGLDGLSISIKNHQDKRAFEKMIVTYRGLEDLYNNYLYVFSDLFPIAHGNFTVIPREWQKEFVPANDSIFRRV